MLGAFQACNNFISNNVVTNKTITYSKKMIPMRYLLL